jgi:hypothetical protein
MAELFTIGFSTFSYFSSAFKLNTQKRVNQFANKLIFVLTFSLNQTFRTARIHRGKKDNNNKYYITEKVAKISFD